MVEMLQNLGYVCLGSVSVAGWCIGDIVEDFRALNTGDPLGNGAGLE